MYFNSLEFILFFPIVLCLTYVFRNNVVVRNIILLFASYFFYACWDYRFLTLIIFSTLADFTISLEIYKANKPVTRKILLISSLAVNLGLLGFFKYYGFFVSEAQRLVSALGFGYSFKVLEIVLPVGISFYTFQTMSYTIDVYKKHLVPTTNLLNFATFVAFFPQLVAGPIERAVNFLPQISGKSQLNINYELSLQIILWGLFKKIVVADNCGLLVDEIFADVSSYGAAAKVLGMFLFSFQIYCDFSGYSDIAIGISGLMGIKLMSNFKTPYFSNSLKEFWRRWHISLSSWFRDYLFIPLGGSKTSLMKFRLNLFIVFIVSGFWHGANWTFILWGGLHACFMILEGTKSHLTLSNAKVFMFLKSLRIFVLVSILWVFFRAQSTSQALEYLRSIFSMSDGDMINFDCYVFCSIILLIAGDYVSRSYESFGHFMLTLDERARILITAIILFTCLTLSPSGNRSFIYFQF